MSDGATTSASSGSASWAPTWRATSRAAASARGRLRPRSGRWRSGWRRHPRGGHRRWRKDLAALVRMLERPRRIVVLVPGGAPGGRGARRARSAARGRRRRGRRRQQPASRTRTAASKSRAPAARGASSAWAVSGGAEGALTGPSMMPGGDREAWERLRPLLESIAARSDSGPASRTAAGSAGHFVKMVHNGIEYGDMQLIAETATLLRADWVSLPADVADTFDRLERGRARELPRRDHGADLPRPGSRSGRARSCSMPDAGPRGPEGHGPLDRQGGARPRRRGADHRRGRGRPRSELGRRRAAGARRGGLRRFADRRARWQASRRTTCATRSTPRRSRATPRASIFLPRAAVRSGATARTGRRSHASGRPAASSARASSTTCARRSTPSPTRCSC